MNFTTENAKDLLQGANIVTPNESNPHGSIKKALCLVEYYCDVADPTYIHIESLMYNGHEIEEGEPGEQHIKDHLTQMIETELQQERQWSTEERFDER